MRQRNKRLPPDGWRTWLLAWLGAAVLGVANGIARGALYEKPLGPRPAHTVSSASLLAALTAYMTALARRWPAQERQALRIGLAWCALTVAFEFSFGRCVAHEGWASLFAQYDVRRGSLWILVPIWMATGPLVINRRVRQR